MLQHIIRGATLERFDGHLFAKRTGDENERYFGKSLFRNREGGQSVERRQTVIGKNNVRSLVVQRLNELGLALDALRLVIQTSLAQLAVDQDGVTAVVFHQQDTDWRIYHE